MSNWIQSTPGRWEISAENPLAGSFSLHHSYNNPVSGHDGISLPIPGLQLNGNQTAWRFKIKHSYPPSAANNWAVFLISNREASDMVPQGTADGYIIGVNYSGSDDHVKLWKSKAGSTGPVIETWFNWQSLVSTEKTVFFEIIRSELGLWSIVIDTTGTGNEWFHIGSATDPELFQPLYFGIYYEYSSAQDRKLWFDDLEITGIFVEDTVPPRVRTLNILHPQTLVLQYDEPVRKLSATDSLKFRVDRSIGHPADILSPDQATQWLIFNEPFSNGEFYNLSLGRIKDPTGNELPDTVIRFEYHIPAPYELVINEIMADPIPPIGLPESEYIEVLNTSGYDLLASGWSIGVGAHLKPIPIFYIPGGSYGLLISRSDTAGYREFGTVIDLDGLPALTNAGQTITIYNQNKQVISSITYSVDWYGDDLKSDGGWSLEQIDPLYPCAEATNWRASVDISGGTPGRQNSVLSSNTDLGAPEVINVFIMDSTQLMVGFNEIYSRLKAGDPDNFNVDQGIGAPDSVTLISPGFNRLILHFQKEFEPGIEYVLSVGSGLTDCAGNAVESGQIRFGFPSSCDSLDVVINEVLFNPLAGGNDFVELYNRSDKILDLGTLSVATRDAQDGSVKSAQMISGHGLLMFPGDYVVLTASSESVLQFYWTSDENQFIELNKMPAYSNDKGTVVLLTKWLNIIDEFRYAESMHHALLKSGEGVSLERIHPDLPTSDLLNWHSAAESVGFATPGLINSQFADKVAGTDPVWVNPEIFSPDNDGHDDVVFLNYEFKEPGYVANVMVFNSQGRLIRRLVNNQLCGTSGSFIWNGEDDGGQRAGIGIYVIFLEVYNLKGEVKAYKKTCVLATRF